MANASIAASLPQLTPAFTASVRPGCAIAANLPQLVPAFVEAAPVTAAISATLPQLTPAIAGRPRVTSIIAATLPQLTPAFAASRRVTADIAFTYRFNMGTHTYIESGSGGATVLGYRGAYVVGDPAKVAGSGGAKASGSAGTVFPLNAVVSMSGGAQAGGAAVVLDNHLSITATLPLIGASLHVINDRIVAKLTHLTSSVSIVANTLATIDTTIPIPIASLKGGVYQINAKLWPVTASVSTYQGVSAAISAALPKVGAQITAFTGGTCSISTRLPTVGAVITARAGFTATISTRLPHIGADITAFAGNVAAVATTLPTIAAALNAGHGAVATISASSPTVTAAITILAQATTQQLVMVVGTHNNVVSTYEDYPFNSFCELGGVYYAAGPDGLCQIDVGDVDNASASKINAGLSTGLMQFSEPHLKRISDAYMTLRTAGNLTLTITVDEGVPVILTMTAHEFATFIQRRVITPKGLIGKSWKFEINNVDGADFDFGQLGFNVAVSARRIRG